MSEETKDREGHQPGQTIQMPLPQRSPPTTRRNAVRLSAVQNVGPNGHVSTVYTNRPPSLDRCSVTVVAKSGDSVPAKDMRDKDGEDKGYSGFGNAPGPWEAAVAQQHAVCGYAKVLTMLKEQDHLRKALSESAVRCSTCIAECMQDFVDMGMAENEFEKELEALHNNDSHYYEWVVMRSSWRQEPFESRCVECGA